MSMPSIYERREVAARLRDMAPGSDWPNYVAEACGMDVSKMSNNLHTFTEQLCQRIADLIEPEERTCRMEPTGDGSVVCSACRTEYTSRWLHEGEYVERYCPNCGARVEVDQ